MTGKIEILALELAVRLIHPSGEPDADPQQIRNLLLPYVGAILRRYKHIFTDEQLTERLDYAAKAYFSGSRVISFADTLIKVMDASAQNIGKEIPSLNSKTNWYSAQSYEGTGLRTFEQTRTSAPERVVIHFDGGGE